MRAKSGDLAAALPRAWGGREPIYRDGEGRFGLNLHSRKLEEFLEYTCIRPGLFADLPSRPELEMPDETVPLSPEEVGYALLEAEQDRIRPDVMAAAVLDAEERPTPLRTVEAILSGIFGHRCRLGSLSRRFRRSRLVRRNERGMLVLDRRHPDLGPIRSYLRRRARASLEDDCHAQMIEEAVEKRQEERKAERRRREVEAALLRRGVLHCLPNARKPAVFGVLEPQSREVVTAPAGEAEEVVARVARLDVVAGLDVRETVAALGLEPDEFVLRDLRPPKKNVKWPTSGKMIRISPSDLVFWSTGIDIPLSDPKDVARELAGGREAQVLHRTAFDLEALFALYRYGLLHGFVCFCLGSRWKCFDVDWAEPGDLDLGQQIRNAAEAGRDVEVVIGKAPEWPNLWEGARRARAVETGMCTGWLVDPGTGEPYRGIGRVQAIRLV